MEDGPATVGSKGAENMAVGKSDDSGPQDGWREDRFEDALGLLQQTADMLPGLKQLQAWIGGIKDIAQFTQSRQEALAAVSWEAFDAPQPQVAPLAKKLFSTAWDKLNRATDCTLATTLLQRALTNVYCKQALFVLELLLERRGPSIFEDAKFMQGWSLSELLTSLLLHPKGIDVGNRRRAKLALSLIQSKAKELGLQHVKGIPDTSRTPWDAWCGCWLGPLSSAISGSSPSERLALSSHFLGPFFEFSRFAMHELLHHLCNQPSTSRGPVAPAVVSVLRAGKDLGLVSTAGTGDSSLGGKPNLSASRYVVDIPQQLLAAWVDSPDVEVQVGALGIISASRLSAMPFSRQELTVVQDFLINTLEGVPPEARTAIRGFYQNVLSRLRASTHAASRAQQGLARHVALSTETDFQAILDDAESFFQKISETILAHLHPGCSFSALTTALSYLEHALEAGLDQFEVSPRNAQRDERFPFKIRLTDTVMTESLLRLVNNTYDSISDKALSLLKRFPKPLPGLEDDPAVQGKLIKPAVELLRGTRAWEAHNAAALLDLYHHVYIKHLGWPAFNIGPQSAGLSGGLGCMDGLLDFLTVQMEEAERVGLPSAAETSPLAAALTATERLVRMGAFNAAPEYARPLASKSLKIIDSVWGIVSPVLCSAAPEGNTGEKDERSRAMDFIDEGSDQIAPKFQVVLTYAWRAIQAASTLLTAVSSAMIAGKIWSREELDAVGQRFIHWLLNVRHRGAFSTMCPAFSQLAAELLTLGKDNHLSSLPQMWLQQFLVRISSPTNALSITRRSAGLGFSVVALLTAARKNLELTQQTIASLRKICEDDEADSSSRQKTAQIHAFNTLRYIVEDGSLASACNSSLSSLILLAINRFSSPLWSVRNAALMLYAAVCIRIFSPQMVNRRHDSHSLPFRELVSKLPGIELLLAEEITRCLRLLERNEGVNQETRLFAILMMLSKVRPTESDQIPHSAQLVQAILYCTASRTWKIREMAAHALVSVLPRIECAPMAKRLVADQASSSNEAHGKWLAILALVQAGDSGSHGEIARVASDTAGDSKMHPCVRHLCSQVAGKLLPTPQDVAPSLQFSTNESNLSILINNAKRTTNKAYFEWLLGRIGSSLDQNPSQALAILFAASDEEESVTVRKQAIAALSAGKGAFRRNTLAYAALLNALDDDDDSIRSAAVRLAAKVLDGTSSSSHESQAHLHLLAESAMTGRTPRRCIQLIYDRLSNSQPPCPQWRQYILSRIVLSPEDYEKQLDRAKPPLARLFAAERPNQHKNRLEEVQRCLSSFQQLAMEPLQEVTLTHISEMAERTLNVLQASPEETNAAERDLLVAQTNAALQVAKLSGAQLMDPLALDKKGALHAQQPDARPIHRIAMVSDFFFPNVGGVEGHIYMVSQCLLARGHKVIVITHAYDPDRVGVRYLAQGLKVYYVPYGVIARQDTLPNFLSFFPYLRTILIRERIEIIHSHQALSAMGHEAIFHSRTMGLNALFTDHSLFGFADAASIMTNKLLRFVLSDIDHVVCVSHVGKENTTLRAHLDPSKVSTIPNAVLTSQFQPQASAKRHGPLTIVVLSRLMYRKGIDLLIATIPRICALDAEVRFLIGGDGPKRVELEQMRERYFLQDRVELVGAIPLSEVQEHLCKGEIFFNASLTEAFGTGIIEAASCGLFIVSTNVGGIPEVLPPDMMELAEPHEDDLVRAAESAIRFVRSGRHKPLEYHKAVKRMYSWGDVAARLEKTYDGIKGNPAPDPITRLRLYYACGPIAGKIFCIIIALDMIILKVLNWLMPADEIDRAKDLHVL